MKIEENIKSLREAQGKSVQFMADVLNIQVNEYERFEENASEMTLKQLDTIANALSVSMVDLVEVESPIGLIKNLFFNHADNKGININVQGINQEEIRKAYKELYASELERIPKLERLLREHNIEINF